MSGVSSSLEERHPHGVACNILLGVTGSVAAVKVPELISRLLDTFGPHISIKLVLTQGGKNFWEKAPTYNAVHWNKIKHLIEQESALRSDAQANMRSKIQVYCKCFHASSVFVNMAFPPSDVSMCLPLFPNLSIVSEFL